MEYAATRILCCRGIVTTESMFPEYPDPENKWSTGYQRWNLTGAEILQTVAHPKPDNSAYLAAMREFRERYEQAERGMGAPVEIAVLEFKRKS